MLTKLAQEIKWFPGAIIPPCYSTFFTM